MGEMTLSILTAEGQRNWVDTCTEKAAAVGDGRVERIRHQCQCWVWAYERFLSDAQGARAVLNAADRLIASQGEQHALAERNMSVMRGQQRDFEARLGAVFPHSAYLEALTELWDQLESALAFDPKKSNGEPPKT